MFVKPNIVHIIPKGPNYEYQINLREVPENLSISENKFKYYIIDTFSRYGVCYYILNNKNWETVLGSIKDFIYKNGKPIIIHSDNGKEFCNNIFDDYGNTYNIKVIRGRPYHPQSQGVVELFKK